MYAPEPYNVPLHSEKGELQMRGNYHWTDDPEYAPSSTGFDYNVSGSVSATPLPHVIVQGGGAVARLDGVIQKENVPTHSLSYWEVGAGTYFDLRDPLMAEVLAGWGQGSVSGTGSDLDAYYRVEGELSRRFLQFDVGVSRLSLEDVAPVLDAGLGLRLSDVELSHLHSDERDVPAQTGALFLEPILVARLQHYGAGIEASMAYSRELRSLTTPYDHIGMKFGIGVSIHPHRFFNDS